MTVTTVIKILVLLPGITVSNNYQMAACALMLWLPAREKNNLAPFVLKERENKLKIL